MALPPTHQATEPAPLADGSTPLDSDGLLAQLAAHGIEYEMVEHAPVYTVDEARVLRGDLPGTHTRNLFLRNRKGRMWLVTLLADRSVDLKSLGQGLDAGRFSFASERRLSDFLGVLPGAVTPLAIVNDHDRQVSLVIDEEIVGASTVWVHPLVNTRTIGLHPSDLLLYLRSVHGDPGILDPLTMTTRQGLLS